MSDTPVLDREQPLPMVKKRFKTWYGLLLGAAIALAKGKDARAHELLARYLTSLDRRPSSGMIAAERSRTVNLLHQIAV